MTAPDQPEEQQGSPAPRTSRIYYEDTANDTYETAQSQPQRIAGTGVLRINVDLLLWRCRTARIRARATTDLSERKNLMRSAEEGLRRCLALDPSDARPYVVLGKLLMLQKRYDEARSLYQEGCQNTGNTNAYVWSAWGWLEYKTANYERARKLLDAATVVDPTHACAWHKWGTLEKEQGNYTRARDLWMQGIQRCRRKPQNQNTYLYNALGVMAAQLGRVGEARAWFEEGTRTAEGAASVALWQAWAVLEAKQGDPSAVRYLFKKSLVANPRSRYTHLAWALWERRLGNLQQCIMLLQRGCSLNPTDPALYQAWALMEKERGAVDRARALFEQGLKADPAHLPLWQAWGVMEAQLGNDTRARELFQEGVWSDPRARSTTYLFHAWGALEQRLGAHDTARELFKAALRVDPKSETVWASWIAMEEELGLLAQAEELRIRRTEQQWEFVVPAGFTTRPEASPLQGLGQTLARFFRLRGDASYDYDESSSSASAGGAGAGEGAAAAAAPAVNLGRLLPSDFQDNLTVDDVMRQIDDPSLASLPMMAPLSDDGVEAMVGPTAPMATGGLLSSGAASAVPGSRRSRAMVSTTGLFRQQQRQQQQQQQQQQHQHQQAPQAVQAQAVDAPQQQGPPQSARKSQKERGRVKAAQQGMPTADGAPADALAATTTAAATPLPAASASSAPGDASSAETHEAPMQQMNPARQSMDWLYDGDDDWALWGGGDPASPDADAAAAGAPPVLLVPKPGRDRLTKRQAPSGRM